MQTILFFDLDGTLVENLYSAKAIRPLLEQIAQSAGIDVRLIGKAMGEENQRRQLTDPDHPLTMDWADIVLTLAAQHGVTLEEGVDERWEAFADAADVLIHDDAPRVLERLKPGRKLVIATKGLSKYQDSVLRVTQLGEWFDDVLTPDITGYLKTSPGYFRRYTNRYPNGEALFIQIGDHYYDDVICTKRNGFYSVLRAPIAELAAHDPFERVARLDAYTDQISTFPEEGSDVRPDAVVVSLQEVPQVVERIEEQQRSARA